MAGPTSCAPCNCIQTNFNDQTFYNAAINVLCQILSAQTLAGAEVTTLSQTTAGAAGGVATAGTIVFTNTGSAKIYQVEVTNTLDVAVDISVDGGTTYIARVAATTGTRAINLAGGYTTTDIKAKAVGSNSTSGSLVIGVVIK